MCGRAGNRAVHGLLVAGVVFLAGCATGPNADPRDPLEPLNRATYQVNQALDDALIKPAATLYSEVTPQLVRTGVRNFFTNLGDVWSFVNNLLQGKMSEAGDSLARVHVNTTLGLGGIFDLAGDLGIAQHREDFGQTLGRWGVAPGPYLVLPFFGPSSLRDAGALVVDSFGNPVSHVSVVRHRNQLLGLSLIDKRAGLLRASALMDDVALDPYSFTRDFYLQLRRSSVYDGDPPPEPVAEPADK